MRTSGTADGTRPPATRLIVHGDDCGLAPHMTDGILRAHERGILTSTSVSVCGSDFPRAAELLASTPSLDVGVHLTLVEERPLLDPRRVPTLVGPEGRFHRHATVFLRRAAAGRISAAEVAAELDAQIRRALDHGLEPSHLDSHQHVHFLPSVLGVVLELAAEHRIPALRLPRRIFDPAGRSRRLSARSLQLLVLDRLARQGGARSTLERTDGFLGFQEGGRLDLEALLLLLERMPAGGTFELMCHPGLPDPHSPYVHWGYGWEKELQGLTSAEARARVAELEIELIGYRDLGAG